jgi:hypothetical protein
MRHVAWVNMPCRVLLTASLVLLMAGVGCSTQHATLQPSPDTPKVIYAIPQSQAFAIARNSIQSSATQCGAEEVHIEEISRGGGIRGYEADYRSYLNQFLVLRHVYVIPTAGTAGGQQIDGFRFQITYDPYRHAEHAPGGIAGECEKSLASMLQTALDATGKATLVTSLRVRPYGQGPAGL